jgi:hypothetical protein
MVDNQVHGGWDRQTMARKNLKDWGLDPDAAGPPVGPDLHIGKVPGRKKVALYARFKSTVRVLAYFSSEEDAEYAINLMDWIVLGRVSPEDDLCDL